MWSSVADKDPQRANIIDLEPDLCVCQLGGKGQVTHTIGTLELPSVGPQICSSCRFADDVAAVSLWLLPYLQHWSMQSVPHCTWEHLRHHCAN